MTKLPERRMHETRTAWLKRATKDPFVVWVFEQYNIISERIHQLPTKDEAKDALTRLDPSDKDLVEKYNEMFARLYPE